MADSDNVAERADDAIRRIANLLERGDRTEAVRLAGRLTTTAARHARTRHTRALLKERQFDDLIGFVDLLQDAGVALTPGEAAMRQRASAARAARRARVLVKSREFEQAIPLLTTAAERGDLRGQLLLAQCYDAVGRATEAEEILERVCRASDPPPSAVLQYANLLYWRGCLYTNPGIEALLESALCRTIGKESHALIVRLGSIYLQARAKEKLASLLNAALDRDFPLEKILQVAWRILDDGKDGPVEVVDAFLDKVDAKLLAVQSEDSSVWLTLARCRYEQDRKDAAHVAVAKAIASATTSQELEAARRFSIAAELGDSLDSLSEPAYRLKLCSIQRGAPGWENMLPDGSVRWKPAHVSRALVAFDNLTLDNKADVEPLATALKERGIALVLIRDQQRQLFVNGFGPYFPDRERAFIGLRCLIQESGVSELATIGFSGGGYAALRYGIAIGARGTLLLSGVTRLPDPGEVEETRAHGTIARIARTRAADYPDLLPLLQEHPGFIIHSHYPEGSPLDRMQAVRLGGLPRAKLFGAPQVRHMIWSYWDTKRWGSVLDKFLVDMKWSLSDS